MFKETKEGQTHSFNDGCGDAKHNMQLKPLNKIPKRELGILIAWAENEIVAWENFIKKIKKELRGRRK